MSGSIKKKIGLFAVIILFIYVSVSFFASYGCIRLIGLKYQNDAAASALDFAALVINADEAKEAYTTRIKSENYDDVQKKLLAYQNNSNIIKRISLVYFNNSYGSYIYDTEGAKLSSKLEYDEYTSSVKAELINGRNSMSHISGGKLTLYRPLRTVDDNLCGFMIVEMDRPYEAVYSPHLISLFVVLTIISLAFVELLLMYVNIKLLRPIKQIADSAVYLSGDDTAQEGRNASIIFDTKRNDEIGRLNAALQKIFFDMNSDAEHLSQAIYDANHDGMTQHLNKRCYHSMEENFRNCKPICVIYFDVNNLKLMNDTLGHESGDHVIKQAADYIRSFLSSGDYCFRMGGDEFLIVMTKCTFRSIDKVVDKLTKDEPYILSRPEDSIKCSLSYGFAYSNSEHDYDELLTQAEENMYAKKAEIKKKLNMPER